MKYTAFAIMVIGLLIVSFAGIQYGSVNAVEPSATQMELPFLFGLSLIVVGVVLWVFGGRGYFRTRTRRYKSSL